MKKRKLVTLSISIMCLSILVVLIVFPTETSIRKNIASKLQIGCPKSAIAPFVSSCDGHMLYDVGKNLMYVSFESSSYIPVIKNRWDIIVSLKNDVIEKISVRKIPIGL